MASRTRSIVLLGMALALASPPQLVGQEKKDPAEENARIVAEIKARIAGKEKAPAKEVFKNLKMLGDMPAERLLGVMQMGYAKSLGVSCFHCHVEGAFESDQKDAKQVARDMSAMLRVIREQLKGMEKLGSREPVVNCTTCHRGNVKPATNM